MGIFKFHMKINMRFLGIVLFLLIAKFSFPQSPPVIPYWAFGHWIWEDQYNTRQSLEFLVNGYLVNNIPVDAVIIDSPWMNSYNDFTWDENRYPRAKTMVDELHAKGICIVPFYTGAINSTSSDTKLQRCGTYDFVKTAGFCINDNQESRWWKGNALHIDFTNNDAKNWWHTQVDKLHEIHADGAKIDFAFKFFGDTVKTSLGKMLNTDFGYYYYKDAFDYNTAKNDEFVAMTYAWSGRGLVGFPSFSHVNWVGDFRGDWQGINDQLQNIYNSANDGFSGIGCEIGGYWEVPSNKEQFIRYTQLASLCPVMINGGSLGAFAHHLPWNHDAETLNIYRKFVKLHRDLSIYLFSAGVDANLNHGTIIKNPSFHNKTHFLGDDFFVHVICDSLKEVKIKLPEEGMWINYFKADLIFKSSELILKEFDLESYPLFVRAGAIIPFINNEKHLHSESLEINIYPFGNSEKVIHKPVSDGVGYNDILLSINEKTGIINVTSKKELTYVFIIKCFEEPFDVKNSDSWRYNKQNNLLVIEKKGENFQIKIKGMVGYSFFTN